MKKIYALTLLLFFNLTFFIQPASAILENNKKQTNSTDTIIQAINIDLWRKTNDPYLEGYIIQAIENNNDIKTASLKIEQAKINVINTRSDLFPQLSIGGSPAIAKMPETTKTQGSFALPIMASWELDIFGKNYDKTKSAKIMLKSAQYQADASNIAVISMLAATYYNIVKLDKIIELQEQLTLDRKEIYNLMKLSNHEGIVSTQDMILAEKSYVMSENDLLDYKKTRQNALNSLAVLIGDSANNTKEYKRISYESLSNNIEIPKEINSEVIVNRPDYKALERQLEAGGIDIRIAKKEFLPTINILGIMSFLATSMSSTMNWENSLSLLAANATLPIFTGFKRTANLKLNKNKYEQLLQQYQKTNLVAIQEVNDSLYNLKSDNEKLKNNTKALNIQNKDYSLSKQKYNKGVISKLDLLQQKETLLFTQQLQAMSKMDCYIDKISLYKATGAKI